MRFLILALTFALSTPVWADDDFRLGSTLLLSVGESKAIVKPLTCRYVNELQVKVEDQEARIESLKVFYRDGSSKTIKVNKNIAKNERSNWLKLDCRKCITKVQVEGYAKRKVAEVKVYGRRD